MKRTVRPLVPFVAALAATSVSAQEPQIFLGGSLDTSGTGSSSSSTLTAPWRGGRHSGPVPDYHLVHRGDTLWDITGYYYGNPWDWPRVWAINPEIANPHWIYPDGRVRLRGGSGSGTVTPSGEGNPDEPHVATRASGQNGPIRVRSDGFIDPTALENRGRIVGSPTDHMMLAPGDEIWLRYADGEEPRAGTNLTIYRRIPEHERDPDEHGELVRILGSAVVRDYDRDRDVVRAEILDSVEPIERGFEVAEVPRRFDDVPPVPNDRDIQTTVAATLYPRDIVGDQQLVFAEVGEAEGVRVGNRFFVVREADPWFDSLATRRQHAAAADGRTTPEDDVEFPPEVIAEARVVSVRPHSCTLMVTRATQEIAVGERLEMRRGF